MKISINYNISKNYIHWNFSIELNHLKGEGFLKVLPPPYLGVTALLDPPKGLNASHLLRLLAETFLLNWV